VIVCVVVWEMAAVGFGVGDGAGVDGAAGATGATGATGVPGLGAEGDPPVGTAGTGTGGAAGVEAGAGAVGAVGVDAVTLGLVGAGDGAAVGAGAAVVGPLTGVVGGVAPPDASARACPASTSATTIATAAIPSFAQYRDLIGWLHRTPGRRSEAPAGCGSG